MHEQQAVFHTKGQVYGNDSRPRKYVLSMVALILNWAGHPTSTTPTTNNNHVELAHAQLVGELAKKYRARFARGKYLQQLCVSTPLSQILDTPLPGYMYMERGPKLHDPAGI